MSTRCPPSLRFLSIFCRSNNFPDALIRALPSYMPLGILGASWGEKQRKKHWKKTQQSSSNPGRNKSGTTYHCSHGKEIWVVAALLKIHHHIQQRDLVATTSSIECFKISSEDVLVVFPAWAREEDKSDSSLHMPQNAVLRSEIFLPIYLTLGLRKPNKHYHHHHFK